MINFNEKITNIDFTNVDTGGKVDHFFNSSKQGHKPSVSLKIKAVTGLTRMNLGESYTLKVEILKNLSNEFDLIQHDSQTFTPNKDNSFNIGNNTGSIFVVQEFNLELNQFGVFIVKFTLEKNGVELDTYKECYEMFETK